MVALDAVSAAGIKERGRSHYIGAHKGLRIRDGAVYMALSRKIYHHIRLFLLKQFKNKCPVCNIAFYEPVVRLILNRL